MDYTQEGDEKYVDEYGEPIPTELITDDMRMDAERQRIQQIINKRRKAETQAKIREQAKQQGMLISAASELNPGVRAVMPDLKERMLFENYLEKHGPIIDLESLDNSCVGKEWGRELVLTFDKYENGQVVTQKRTEYLGYIQLTATFSLYEFKKRPIRYAYCTCIRCQKIFRVIAAKLKPGIFGCARCAQYATGRMRRQETHTSARLSNEDQARLTAEKMRAEAEQMINDSLGPNANRAF